MVALVGDLSNVKALVSILGCKVSKLLMTYLGLRFGSIFKEKAVWNYVLEKMERSLVGWKRMPLSKVECPTSLPTIYPYFPYGWVWKLVAE